ncbi:50S ribosomal protein L3 N(5)-glutamine methyltransferase [Synoicihabitans lomoniglobus]|uniref:50S ribosomal protein L3 N(5)-glutamine methyltransferase n=1 Tax=Synoicihabitans lomoniglobus TaxID=2909285 RepID=A0AAF0A0B2_9BACT|nr:50S ribosomal protein L3 N(5)-glutamine methyltransferase [Opitutaceae bacterium LMO-M01]WED64888.1 50S ribosomal protein L3 N(5)-glutamine methyltransferase [Opitutaceae bacterium LMO-M01]
MYLPTSDLLTPAHWLGWAETAYAEHELVLGQVADNAHDEALYLILRTLELPLDSPAKVMRRLLSGEQLQRLTDVFTRRVAERVPAGYLTREAWLGEYSFYCDERVIIPRSYFLELIPTLSGYLPEGLVVTNAVDVCTGSGCLAILLAHQFPSARVDGIDLSPDALEVAQINVRDHAVGDRLTLHRSDVFDAVPVRRYDIILSNPPYEPSDICDDLPPEFAHEPRLALDGGADGLDIIRKLLRQAMERLQPHGIVVLEVGELRPAMERAWPKLRMKWLETADGSNCCCLIRGDDLATIRG